MYNILADSELTEELKERVIERNIWLINITDFDETSVDLWFCMCLVNDNDRPVRIFLPGRHGTELPGNVYGLLSVGDKEHDTRVFRRWLRKNLEDFSDLEGLLGHLDKTVPPDGENDAD